MEFDFNEWLNEHGLTKYNEIFCDYSMNTLESLNFHNPNYTKLMADDRIRKNSLILTKVIQSIQLLQLKRRRNDNNSYKNDSDTLQSVQSFYIISNEENQVLETINQNLNDLKKLQKYALSMNVKCKLINKRNTEKTLSYLEELNKMKQEIKTIFNKIYNKLKQKENNLLSRIKKHENLINEKKEQILNDIESKLKHNENMLIHHENYLKSEILKYRDIIKQYHSHSPLQRKQKILNISFNVNTENIKLMKTYNLNKKAIKQYMNSEDIDCKKIYVQLNDDIFQHISSIANIIKYDDNMTVQIKNADLLNKNTLKLSFDTKHKYDNYLIRKYDVLYYFTMNEQTDLNQKNTKQIEWKRPHKINITKNNNVLIIFNDDNDEKYDDDDIGNNKNFKKYLYIKVRIQNSMNVWSSFSSVCKMQIEQIQTTSNIDHDPIFYLSQSNGIFCADLNISTKRKRNSHNDTNRKCNIYEFNDDDILDDIITTDSTKWIIKNCGLCYHKKMGNMIPNLLKQKMDKMLLNMYIEEGKQIKNECFLNKNDEYDIIFKCGGYKSSYCSAIIIDRNQLKHNHDNKNDICLFNWKLPNLKTSIDGNCLIYDNSELFSIGGIEKRYGYSDKMYCLSLNNIENEWNWYNLPKMQTKRCWSTSVMIKTDKTDKSLIVIGGRNHWGSQTMVEIFDFNTSKWNYLTSCNYARYKAGICYDINLNSIYIGGGHNAQQKIEAYDIIKNKWYNVPDTKMKHESYPSIWKDANNFLYIASIDSNGIECIDLRTDKNNGWNALLGNHDKQQTKNTYLLQNIFNTQFVDKVYCRLCK